MPTTHIPASPTRHSESLRPESYRPCEWNSAQDRQGPEATVKIEYRWAEGQAERLSAFADELVRLKVSVIVTSATPPTIAAKRAARAHSPTLWMPELFPDGANDAGLSPRVV